MERRERRAALRALDAEEFEWLIHALVQAESLTKGLQARKMRAPDRGADTLVVAPDGRTVQVVQAKHYSSKIHWKKCEESLAVAVKTWRPAEVLFAFSCDFTAAQQQAFSTRLVAPPQDTLVRAWTLSDIELRLDEHPEIGVRFFGAAAVSISQAIERAARFGGLQLNSADDLLDRARELAEHGTELDPHFEYATYSGPISASPPIWPSSPAATVTFDDGNVRVEVAAFARPDHDPGEEVVTYSDDEAGRAALESARTALGAGMPIVLRDGIEVTRSLKPRLAQLIEMPIAWAVHLGPSEPTEVRIRVTNGTETFERVFPLYQVPPRGDGTFAFIGSTRGLRLELNMTAEFATSGKIWAELWTDYGHDASQNLEASECLRIWVNRIETDFSGPLLGGGIHMTFDQEPGFTAEEFDELYSKIDLFRRTVEIETYFGRRLNFPIPPMVSDAKQLLNASQILRTRSGWVEFRAEPLTVDANELAALAREIELQPIEKLRVELPLFGDLLDFGDAEYRRPKLRIIDIRPMGSTPTSPAEVRLEPLGTPRVAWNLLGPPPRLAGAP